MNLMTMTNKIHICKCEGCVLIDGCDVFQVDSYYVHICPCSICLVKTVCNDNCEEYGDFTNKIYNDKYFIKCVNKKKKMGMVWSDSAMRRPK